MLFLTEARKRCAIPLARAVELTVAKNRQGYTGKGRVDLSPGRRHHVAREDGKQPEVGEG